MYTLIGTWTFNGDSLNAQPLIGISIYTEGNYVCIMYMYTAEFCIYDDRNYVYMMICIYEEGNHVNRMIGVKLNTKRDGVNLLSL